jgi:hypothetical protein
MKSNLKLFIKGFSFQRIVYSCMHSRQNAAHSWNGLKV